MRLPETIQKAIDAENRQRALAWHPLAPDLCGAPVNHYTARMRLDLEMAGNAFAVLRLPRRHDVFAFLWRLNPAYARMERPAALARRAPRFCKRAVRLLRAWRAFGGPRSAVAFCCLERHVAALEHPAAVEEILRYRRTVFKDRPAAALTEHKSLIPKPQPHWCDDLVEFFGTHFSGWPRDAILDAPMAQLFQLWRAFAIAHGQGVIDETAALVSDYARRRLEVYRSGQVAEPSRN